MAHGFGHSSGACNLTLDWGAECGRGAVRCYARSPATAATPLFASWFLSAREQHQGIAIWNRTASMPALQITMRGGGSNSGAGPTVWGRRLFWWTQQRLCYPIWPCHDAHAKKRSLAAGEVGDINQTVDHHHGGCERLLPRTSPRTRSQHTRS